MSFAKRGKSSKAKVPKAQLAARANWRSPSTPQTVEIPSGDSMNHTAFRNKTCVVILSWNFCQPEAESWFGLIWKQNATHLSENPCFRGLFNCSSLTQVHHKNCLASPSRVLTAGPLESVACHSLSWVVLTWNDIHPIFNVLKMHPKLSPCWNLCSPTSKILPTATHYLQANGTGMTFISIEKATTSWGRFPWIMLPQQLKTLCCSRGKNHTMSLPGGFEQVPQWHKLLLVFQKTPWFA